MIQFFDVGKPPEDSCSHVKKIEAAADFGTRLKASTVHYIPEKTGDWRPQCSRINSLLWAY